MSVRRCDWQGELGAAFESAYGTPSTLWQYRANHTVVFILLRIRLAPLYFYTLISSPVPGFSTIPGFFLLGDLKSSSRLRSTCSPASSLLFPSAFLETSTLRITVLLRDQNRVAEVLVVLPAASLKNMISLFKFAYDYRSHPCQDSASEASTPFSPVVPYAPTNELQRSPGQRRVHVARGGECT